MPQEVQFGSPLVLAVAAFLVALALALLRDTGNAGWRRAAVSAIR